MEIKIPYSTRPTMSRTVGKIWCETPSLLEQSYKWSELDQWGTLLYGEQSGINRYLDLAAKITGRVAGGSFLQFAMTFQEDVVLLHHGKVIALCVVYPSGWVPREKLGCSLTQIHSNVADSSHLVSASDKIAEVLQNKEGISYCRSVWTVTPNSKLSNLPNSVEVSEPVSIDDLYFRTEYQTSCPLGDGESCLFFIKVDVKPLRTVWVEYGESITKSI